MAELPALRRMPDGGTHLGGPVARRMLAAVRHHLHADFVTPMAAVAGAVADEVLAAMLAAARLERAYVNNGGDAAFHLAVGQALTVAMPGTGGALTIAHDDPVRGVATSGWGGRSHSLGIADAVTVLAASAAAADAAVTLIANAVDLPGHPAITRKPANTLDPDSDLGMRLVTTGVGRLGDADVAEALARGMDRAKEMRSQGLICAAAIGLKGRVRILGQRSGTARSNAGAYQLVRGGWPSPKADTAIPANVLGLSPR